MFRKCVGLIFKAVALFGLTVSQEVGSCGWEGSEIPLSTHVYHAPDRVRELKDNLLHIPDMPASSFQISQAPFSEKNYIDVATSEYKFCHTNPSKVLYTTAVIDCIALCIYDTDTQTFMLSHVSKMSLRGHERGHPTYFEKWEIPDIEKNFPDKRRTKIYIISTYYSQDLLEVVKTLKHHGYELSGKHILDRAYRYKDAYCRQREVFLDKQTVPEFLWEPSSVGSFTVAMRCSDGGIAYNLS